MSASDLDRYVGLKGAKLALRRIFELNPPVHAVLLYGQPGCGKTCLAKMLAAYWLCAAPSSSGACGECQPCRAFLKGNCADSLWIGPQGASGWIRSAAIAEPKTRTDEDPPVPLQTFFRTQPLYSRNKVVTLDRIDRLNPQAANSLLKTLEEPQPYGKLILTTSAVGLVLPTIVSRSMAIACEAPTPDEWTEVADFEQLPGMNVGQALDEPWRKSMYLGLQELVAQLSVPQASRSLSLAEAFKGLSERCASDSGLPARVVTAEVVKGFGELMSASGSNHEQRTLIAEAHRRVLGNVNSSLVIDSLFVSLATQRTYCITSGT